MLVQVKKCVLKSRSLLGKKFSQFELDPFTFNNVPDDSIGHAIMEKSNCLAVIACAKGWSDLGSWKSLGDLDPPDINGNRVRGSAFLHDTINCTIQSADRLVGVVGLQNLIIIDTPDALLVTEKSWAEDVKHIYSALKASEHDAYRLHRTVHRPWGTYTILEEGVSFEIKRIVVNPGGSLSLQMHRHRSEHWVVVSGSALVVNGEAEIVVNTNESTYLPAGYKHRLTNIHSIPCVMIEVQSGSYVGEDDIIRFEDVYGRISK